MAKKETQKCSEGNTGLLSKKSRLQCFTSFAELEPSFDKSKMRYLAYGKETCPSTGKQHWQGFVYWKNGHSIKSTSKWFNNAHVEHCRGSLEDNEKYCSKEGQYKTFGEKPQQGTRTDLIELKTQIWNGEKTVEDIRNEEPMTYHLYGRTLEKIEDDKLRKQFRNWMTEGVWFWGKTGVGKSHRAFENFDPDTHYVWTAEDKNWWDGYIGQPIVILNDFRGQLAYDTILNLVDKWPFNVPRRGRVPYPFLAKKVIVTSPLPPDEVFNKRCEKDSIEQLLRRFTVISL